MAASAPFHWRSSAPMTFMLPEAGQRFHVGKSCNRLPPGLSHRHGSQDIQGASSDILAFTGLASLFYSEGKGPLCQVPLFLTRV